MKLRGGCNVLVAGRPSSRVRTLPLPQELYLPLASRRFAFTDVRVEDGARVRAGEILAVDPDAYFVPLLAPYAGTAHLNELEGHIVLRSLEAPPDESGAAEAKGIVSSGEGAGGAATRRLLELGAWQYVTDACTGAPADPDLRPAAVIVSTVQFEPFLARGDVLLQRDLAAFVRGLEHIQKLLEYESIFVVMPDVATPFAQKFREAVRGYAFVQLRSIPLRYPFDHHGLLIRHLGIRLEPDKPVWVIPTAGVFAIDGALTRGIPATRRVISLGGPAVDEPEHLEAVTGYPIEEIIAGRLCGEPARILRGGILTGEEVGPVEGGIDAECEGLTVLAEETRRHLLAFAMPGLSKRSISRTFLSWYCAGPAERLNTSRRGEVRPCIACGQCVDLCPAGIMPNFIHKFIYEDDLDRVHYMRIELCVECGVCSYVCPSKIDLRHEIIDTKCAIQEELEAVVLEAAEAKA
jgi:Na+-transporting NADH:ubiquinone oxidoreductase subunit A